MDKKLLFVVMVLLGIALRLIPETEKYSVWFFLLLVIALIINVRFVGIKLFVVFLAIILASHFFTGKSPTENIQEFIADSSVPEKVVVPPSKPNAAPSPKPQSGKGLSADEIQWLAKLTACVGQYNMAQTGDYSEKDPIDYYRPEHIRKWLAEQSGSRTMTQTFYGICFDYAKWAYDYINQHAAAYELKGMKKDGWYIVGTFNNSRQISLYDPAERGKLGTNIINGVPVKTIAVKNVQAHGNATTHAWLWVYGNDGTIYWIDPTWTDNTGYVRYGVVKNGVEMPMRPSDDYCMIQLPSKTVFAGVNQADAYKSMGNWNKAVADYSKVIQQDPAYARAYYGRGFAYKEQGNYAQAIADYEEALRIDPNDALTQNALAEVRRSSWPQEEEEYEETDMTWNSEAESTGENPWEKKDEDTEWEW